jgi:hypothetical protein
MDIDRCNPSFKQCAYRSETEFVHYGVWELLKCINTHNLYCEKNIWFPDTDTETSKIKFPLIVTHYALLEISIRDWGRMFTHRTIFGAIHIHLLGVEMMVDIYCVWNQVNYINSTFNSYSRTFIYIYCLLLWLSILLDILIWPYDLTQCNVYLFLYMF